MIEVGDVYLLSIEARVARQRNWQSREQQANNTLSVFGVTAAHLHAHNRCTRQTQKNVSAFV